MNGTASAPIFYEVVLNLVFWVWHFCDEFLKPEMRVLIGSDTGKWLHIIPAWSERYHTGHHLQPCLLLYINRQLHLHPWTLLMPLLQLLLSCRFHEKNIFWRYLLIRVRLFWGKRWRTSVQEFSFWPFSSIFMKSRELPLRIPQLPAIATHKGFFCMLPSSGSFW